MDDYNGMYEHIEQASRLLKVLANQDRLMILCMLAEGEKNVSELEEILEIRQPTLSQQLARLRADGLVATRRQGKAIYYSLTSDEAGRIIGVLYEVYCQPDAGATAKIAANQ